jgi:hypothetical protein
MMPMPDPDLSSGAAFAREPSDPFGTLIAAACDAMTAGLSTLRLMAKRAGAASPTAGRATGGDPLSALTALASGYSAAISDFVAQGMGQETEPRGESKAASLDGFAAGMDISALMARAMMVGAAGTLRYWGGVAGVYARHQATLTQAAARHRIAQPPTGQVEDRLLVDNLRVFLRDIADVAMQEARHMESELDLIGEALAARIMDPDPEYRRRWKAKD